MSTIVRVEGEPLLRVYVEGLPSWNKNFRHWTDKAQNTRSWRSMGARLAHNAKMGLTRRWPIKTKRDFVVKTGMMINRIFPPHEGEMDVFNVNIKAVTDGFTDASIWPNDEWAYIPLVMFMWGGSFSKARYHSGKKWVGLSTTEIGIYELRAVFLNGVEQNLPDGRERIVPGTKPIIDWRRWENISEDDWRDE